MTKLKRLGSLLLALIFAFSMTCTAFAADEGENATGSITITNATIGETYRVYKLFDASYSTSVDDEGNKVTNTAYVATKAQKEALEAETDNVFAFTKLTDDSYQVTIGTTTDEGSDEPRSFTNTEVIDFVKTYFLELGSGIIVCNFPGATEEEVVKATTSTVEITGLEYGYYFVTSSLGTVISLDTTNPDAEIVDKNTSTPTWDNDSDEPEPDEPVKDVLNEAGTRSINEETVAVGDVLTYSISYTNTAYDDDADAGVTLSEVVIYDAAPDGTTYKDSSIAIQVLDASGDDVTSTLTTDTDDTADDDTLTWTVEDLPYEYTVVATFQVTVTEDALELTNPDKTIVNDADLDVTLGEHTYKLKTNEVENPVEEEGEDEPDEPVKDVKAEDYDPAEETTQGSINGETVSVGDILTYTIEYTNTETDEEGNGVAVDLYIKDTAPTGTVYVSGSAASTVKGTDISIDANGIITWFVDDLAAGATVTVYFQVEVTDVALSITDKTVVNTADYSFNGEDFNETNVVKNPVEDEGGDEEPEDFGKVIINEDGTETTVSTGAFGDTVTFDVSIDAVNLVTDEGRDENTNNDQVAYYYIYDQMVPGFELTGNFTLTIDGVEYAVTETGTSSSGATTYTIGNGTDTVGTLYTYVDGDGNSLIGATIIWADDKGNGLYPNCEIHLIYTATITTSATIAGNGNVNRAIYDYSVVGDNDPDDPPYEPDPENPEYPDGSDLNHETEERTTVTYTYALGIYKVNENGDPLSGAVFSFVDAGGNTIYGVATDVDGVYNYSSTATGATDKFTSNSDGQIIIKGVDIGTYTLTEVQAPSGYTLLTETKTIKASMTSSTTTFTVAATSVTRYFEALDEEAYNAYEDTVYTKDDAGAFVEYTGDTYADGLYKLVDSSSTDAEEETVVETEAYDVSVTSVTVENVAGSSLPSTGGIGTTIFYVVGGVLVVGAVVLFITKKRMGE